MTTPRVSRATVEWGPESTPEAREASRLEFERYSADCAHLAEQRDDLASHYADQWIGMFQGKLFVAAELDALLGDLRHSGISPDRAVVRFLHRVAPKYAHSH